MEHINIKYSNNATDFYFNSDLELLKELAPTDSSIIITDENLMLHYQDAFKPWRCITIPAGEGSKNLEILDDIIRQLIALEAGRNATIIGVGGGVITDIAGFVAAVYKRGVRCGFVPTSILGMVDASIGGKNGLDIGEYKNMIGTIRQPDFILYDYHFLISLPQEERVNGFAEIIKHAAINDWHLFELLERNSIADFFDDSASLNSLIKRNVEIKATIVQQDELEKNERKKLNFGHTLAHAIENHYQLPHGYAVSIGMAFAARLSEQLKGFAEAERLINLIKRYNLPVTLDFNASMVYQTLLADKKRNDHSIDFILLKEIGKAVIEPISLTTLKQVLIPQ